MIFISRQINPPSSK